MMETALTGSRANSYSLQYRTVPYRTLGTARSTLFRVYTGVLLSTAHASCAVRPRRSSSSYPGHPGGAEHPAPSDHRLSDVICCWQAAKRNYEGEAALAGAWAATDGRRSSE